MQKTVYILGAGFSAAAGGPEQSRLIQKIFNLPDDAPETTKAKKDLEAFLVDVLNIDTDKKSEANLEDVYTPIDRCLADGQSLRDKTLTQLHALRGHMEYLISLAVDRSFIDKSAKDPRCREYVDTFAKHLVNIAWQRGQKARGAVSADEAKAYDPFSIICLNWDVLLDKAIYRALKTKDHGTNGDYEPIGVVDYCCYISSLEEHELRVRPGLWALGARGYNIKLLKLHGSMNWLQCSHCQQVFVSFDEKINISNYINVGYCRHCKKRGVSATLQGALVMPTFLKDLSNFQIKLVWQNAAVELMEADKLIFIGYSLPQADFEFRQMLTRMVRKDAKVEVILFHDGTTNRKLKFDEECKRYSQFFGNRLVSTHSDGVLAFVGKLIKPI